MLRKLFDTMLARRYCYTCKAKHSWWGRTIICIDIPWPGSLEAKELYEKSNDRI